MHISTNLSTLCIQSKNIFFILASGFYDFYSTTCDFSLMMMLVEAIGDLILLRHHVMMSSIVI